MAKALIIAETKNGALAKVSLETGTKAVQLGYDVTGIIFGDNANGEELGKVGVPNVIHAKSSEYNGEAYASSIKKIVKEDGYDLILLPHTWTGKDIAGRISALLDSPVVSDIIDLEKNGDKLVATKPVYAGKAFVKLAPKSDIKIFTLRPNAIEVTESPTAVSVKEIDVDLSNVKAKRVDLIAASGTKISLTEANIIVSGGRGIKGPEYFPVLQELSDMLGAALGASRAAVDAGWIDHSHQVGQTGKTVSPALYIAVGISGAIQHLAGMGSSRYIVAINKDKEAPIFKVSTYGLVHDLFEVVPAIKEDLKKLKGN